MSDYFAFQWHITDECDQRCKHCYIFNNEHVDNLKTASMDDIKTIFNNCLDMCDRINRKPFFYLTGGDPILHPNFWDVLQLFKDNNVLFGILGNPFHLNDEVCKRLHDYGCIAYQLSIDGLKETHDYFRMPDSYECTLKAIEYLKNNGIQVNIMTTVSKTNMDEIPGLIDVAVEHEVNTFSFSRYVPEGFDKSAHMTPSEYRNLLDKCWSKYEQYKDTNVNFNLKDHLWTLYLYEKGIFKIDKSLDDDVIYDGCNCANAHLTILPDGKVYSCRRMDSMVGNALEDNLERVFFSKEMDVYRQYDKFSKCSKCELLRFCRGCPAVTKGYTGNMYDADPQCWKEVEAVE